jgi:hypothetical protein
MQNLLGGYSAPWTCTILNRGATPVNYCKVQIYLSNDPYLSLAQDTLMGETFAGYVAPNGSTEVIAKLSIPKDISNFFKTYILVAVDPDNTIPEFNETNNRHGALRESRS